MDDGDIVRVKNVGGKRKVDVPLGEVNENPEDQISASPRSLS